MFKKTFRGLAAYCLVMGLFAGSAFAGDQMGTPSYERTMGLSYNPFQALFGAHTLRLEYKMNDILAPVVQVGVIDNRWSIRPNFNNQPGTFFEFLLGARFYVTGCPLHHGFYVENDVFVAYARTPSGAAITVPYAAGPNQWITGNVFQLGYEYVTDWGFSVDFYANLVGYIGWDFPNSSPGLVDAASYNLNLWKPSVGGRVGYAW